MSPAKLFKRQQAVRLKFFYALRVEVETAKLKKQSDAEIHSSFSWKCIDLDNAGHLRSELWPFASSKAGRHLSVLHKTSKNSVFASSVQDTQHCSKFRL